MQDTGRKYGGEKDGEETNSKEKQDEGESGRGKADFLFFFFYSSTTVYSHQMINNKTSLFGNPYPEPPSSTVIHDNATVFLS